MATIPRATERITGFAVTFAAQIQKPFWLCEHALLFHHSSASLTIELARPLPSRRERRKQAMLYYALMFLIVGLVAGALGLFGIAAVASQIAWVLFLIGVIILVVHLVTGRGTRVL